MLKSIAKLISLAEITNIESEKFCKMLMFYQKTSFF